MEYSIKNKSVSERIELCIDEFSKISSIIDGIGSISHPVPYLTRYAIIRACGAIEYGFKTIISDVNCDGQSDQVKRFVDQKFRYSSMNPSYSNICKSLSIFDENWVTKFKEELNNKTDKARILDSLESLNDARNAFAHGGSPSTTFLNIKNYFSDCVRVLESIEIAIS
jgi:RiboL-PSP-HEPN